MTNEQRLFEILEFPIGEFSTDNRRMPESMWYYNENIQYLKAYIERKELTSAQQYAERVKQGLSKFRQLFRLYHKAPEMFDLTRHGDCNKYANGVYRLGYSQFRGGLKEVFDNIREVSWLVQHYEVRIKKGIVHNKQYLGKR